MKILLLGKGYIGNYIAANLSVKGELVHLNKESLDYSDYETFHAFLKNNKFDWIINSSGYTGRPNVDACEDDKEKCHLYNVTVPLYLTNVANYHQTPIIHIGSGCIYTGYDKAYTEEDLSNFGADSPISSFYSKTKDTFEKLSRDMDRYIFRIRIPFNGIKEPKNYLYKLLNYNKLISSKNSITNVDGLVNMLPMFMSVKPETGIYNVTNPGSIEAKEVVEIMKKHGLENPNWEFVSIPEANFRVGRSNCILDTSKLKDKIGIELTNVYDSVAEAVKQYAKKS
tara:strand:- start:655 stop:1503 length:849 start_codon:yes stop_codon:yes gene_type:complete